MTPGRAVLIPMDLADFINRHAGESAWLFGKGPSLSDFDFSTAGPLRCAINDTIAHIPACTYGFANDGVRRWRDLYQPGQILFQPRRCIWEYEGAPVGVACDLVWFADGYGHERILLPREELARELSIRRGTLGSALQILHLMGISLLYHGQALSNSSNTLVRILENFTDRQIPYSPGQIVSLPPSSARRLIEYCLAEPFQPNNSAP